MIKYQVQFLLKVFCRFKGMSLWQQNPRADQGRQAATKCSVYILCDIQTCCHRLRTCERALLCTGVLCATSHICGWRPLIGCSVLGQGITQKPQTRDLPDTCTFRPWVTSEYIWCIYWGQYKYIQYVIVVGTEGNEWCFLALTFLSKKREYP